MSETKTKVFSIIKKALWGVFLAIFGLVAVVALWLTIDKFILKSPVPSMFGYASLTVETGSMEGTIDIGDMIIIVNVPDSPFYNAKKSFTLIRNLVKIKKPLFNQRPFRFSHKIKMLKPRRITVSPHSYLLCSGSMSSAVTICRYAFMQLTIKLYHFFM